MSKWSEYHDRRGTEWAVRELRKRGTLHTVKGISPEMDRRIKNAERRVDRKDRKS